jgi:hypothetical protein
MESGEAYVEYVAGHLMKSPTKMKMAKNPCHARHEEEEEQDKDRFFKYYEAN